MRSVRAVVIVAAVILVAGCSSMPQVAATYSEDSETIGAINAKARERGVEIIWVHPPTKRVEVAGEKPKNLAER